MDEYRALKKQLRAEALARRDALDPQWRIEASLGMAEWAQRIPVEPGDVVSGFWPMRSEVDVRPLMFAFREQGARLCLPAILDKTTIVFRELVRGADLVDMGFGTYGPGPEAQVLQPVLMLVPLVSPQGWDYVLLLAAPAVAGLLAYQHTLPAWIRLPSLAALAVTRRR